MREKIYNMFVNRVVGIRERYSKKREEAKGTAGRFLCWVYLLYLNVSYYVFRSRKLEGLEKYPYYEIKKIHSSGSESSLSFREEPKELKKRLEQYDVISFDVFDTLVFRPFSDPTDLFYLLGRELEYMDFKGIRCEAERKARKEKMNRDGQDEVTLRDIYDCLEEMTGLSGRETMKREIELEKRCCFANPYMKEVVELLRSAKKRMIVISDMYLPSDEIRCILKKCGYPEFDDYYVSCEWRASKSRGDLYKKVTKQEGEHFAFAHVGDNPVSDIKQAKENGLIPFFYKNVNSAGRKYRPEDLSVITGSIYRGMVNMWIHNGRYQFSKEYEYGYLYGGLFVTGYCQFIHDFAGKEGVDKVLFFSRDGDILCRAYRSLYPEEEGRWEYVYWSRLAAAKLTAGYYKYDYFRRFLEHKKNQGYTLKSIVQSMELDDMLQGLCETTGLSAKDALTDKNIDVCRQYFDHHWEEVKNHYKEQQQAARQYYGNVLTGCKKAVAVDIGWAGSGAVLLDYLVNKEWNLNCSITGIIAGTNTCHNQEPDASETFLQSGKLVSYMYSQHHNRDLWKFHNPGQDHNVYWEVVTASAEGSLKGFYLDKDGRCKCVFKEKSVGEKRIQEIQKGILDFAEHFKSTRELLKDMWYISGRDAYAPMLSPEGERNRRNFREILDLLDDKNVV